MNETMISISLIWLYSLVFAVFHSVTAGQSCKSWFYSKGVLPHRYRLLYSIVGIITTAIWLCFVYQLVDSPLYATKGVLFWLFITVQAIGVMIALAAFIPIDGAVFLGLRKAEQSNDPFIVQGIYKYIRHPMYSGAMLILLAMPEQTVNGLNFAVVVCLYFIVGSRFEEKRMLTEHPSYAAYQERVPAFIPRLITKGRG